ncbi:type II restriction-modification system restriction subunit [Helicobacter pylori]|nr:type II restriction-modification system restriction subunit [Helicobacter pylori]BAW57384.1 type II restriction-modification system restriction subunit [Helicobacter pylori]
MRIKSSNTFGMMSLNLTETSYLILKFNTLEAVVKNFTKEKGRTQFDIFSDDVKELLFNA